MKIPEKPPKLDALLKAFCASGREISELISANYVVPEYYSYSDLKYRPLPDFARERDDWWLKIALQRAEKFKPLPLTDLSGEPFKYFVDDADLAILHYLDFRASDQIESEFSVSGTLFEKKNWLLASLMEESITSSLLEGAATTREKAQKMLRQNATPKTLGERMVLNNFQTMQKLKSWKNEPLSESLILRIHAEISAGTVKSGSEGRFRNPDEKIVVGDDFGNDFYQPPPAEFLRERIQKLCDFANENSAGTAFLHPIVKAIIIHFWLAFEHPFLDGNGRTARALFYWFLLKNDYWICEFFSISTEIRKSGLRYYSAFLNSEIGGNDLNFFIKFHLEILKRAIDGFFALAKQKHDERNATQAQFQRLAELNSRQQNFVENLLKNSQIYFETTIAAYQAENQISWETARRDLLDLAKKKLLRKKRRGNAFVFVPADDLREKLQKF